MGSALLLPGPLPVLRRLAALARTERFAAALGASFFRVMAGIFVAVPLGVACGVAAALDRRAGAFLKPLFQVVSTTPVMAVILLSFLLLGVERTPVFTAFLMVFPLMAANIIEGIRQVDPAFKELFALYRLGALAALRCLYLPAVAPFALGGLRSGLSLSWKVVVAAEVFVQPVRSLGAGMQQAKAQLETTELFAWTVATVLAAALTQGCLSLGLFLFTRARRRRGG